MPESPPVNRQSVANQATHLLVWHVVRQDGSSGDDLRGYQGRLKADYLETGGETKILPGGHTTKIVEIYNPNGKTESVEAGEVLTVTLDTDLDVSRGNSIAAADSPVAPEQQFQVMPYWFGDIPLNFRRKHLPKHTIQTASVRTSAISYVWNVNIPSRVESAGMLKLNDIDNTSLKIQQPITTMPYGENYALGVFILIDETTNHTVTTGVIHGGGRPGSFEI